METVPVAFQGVVGAYSEQAVKEFGSKLGVAFSPVPQDSFRALFEAIVGSVGLGLVPIENSIAGSVVECYDLFVEYDVEIVGEYLLTVRHCLLAPPGVRLRDVSTVFSHPQALLQCRKFIEEHGWDPVAAQDTAGAAKALSGKAAGQSAAIAGEIAAEEYGLQVLARDIQNGNGAGVNQTRFLLVKKKGASFVFERSLGAADKSTVLFQADGIPAALYKCLGGFATNAVNLLKIESRPSQLKNFDYLFYLDFEGAADREPVKRALKELSFFSKMVKMLGSYPRA